MSSAESASDNIAAAFHGWLVSEVETSSEDRNKYLNGFNDWRKGMEYGYDQQRNWTVGKNVGHLDRLTTSWWEAYELVPDNDQVSAKILFSALMFVSGAFRNQCYLQSKTAEEYMERRYDAVGVNIHEVVSERIKACLPEDSDFLDAGINMEHLDEKRIAALKIGERAIRRICVRIPYDRDFGQEESWSVETMKLAQRNWIGFAADAVTLAAKIRRGDLTAVPFLEPRNISDNSAVPVYPLAF